MNNERQTETYTAEHGFTLLEMLVALAIAALAVAVIAPLAGRARAGMELRSTAFDIAAHLRNARSSAQSSNSEQALVVDVAGRRMWSDGQSLRKALPRRFGIDLDIPAAERVGASAGRLRFFPDGSASGGTVVLREGYRTATVSVNWLDGDVQVRWSR